MRGPKPNDRRSPLPRRTGHGDCPHPALACVVSSRKHSQRDQSPMVQMSIYADSPTVTPAPLTATLQMSRQSVSDELIELTKRLALICSMLIPSTPGAPLFRRTTAQAACSTSLRHTNA